MPGTCGYLSNNKSIPMYFKLLVFLVHFVFLFLLLSVVDSGIPIEMNYVNLFGSLLITLGLAFFGERLVVQKSDSQELRSKPLESKIYVFLFIFFFILLNGFGVILGGTDSLDVKLLLLNTVVSLSVVFSFWVLIRLWSFRKK